MDRRIRISGTRGLLPVTLSVISVKSVTMDRSKDDQFLIRSDGFNPSQILYSGGAITEPQTPSGTYMRQSSILKRSVTKLWMV